MNEVKRPKKPLAFYYVIALLAIMLFNSLIMPRFAGRQIQEVDYGTFMSMTENGEIGQVEIQENQILFTSKDGASVYKTGPMTDPGLVERLHASGAEFASEIVEEMVFPPQASSVTMAFTAPLLMAVTVPANLLRAESCISPRPIMTSVALMTAMASLPTSSPSS